MFCKNKHTKYKHERRTSFNFKCANHRNIQYGCRSISLNTLYETKDPVVINSYQYAVVTHYSSAETTKKKNQTTGGCTKHDPSSPINHIISFLMVFHVTCRFILHRRTNTRPYSPVHSTYLPTLRCLLAYATLLAPSKGAW